ncbi:MAG: CinA family protein [Chloroflexi bacterium]|nr:CinA family protein [Chloroflexota bacterium]
MPEPSLEAQIGALLAERKLTLAAAESCTGGLIAHRLTNVPGSSTYFLGGVVAYAYDAKEHLLGVHHATLYDHGAVSKETAIEMARGARRIFSADIAVAVTGIAGPGGGLPNKPVGLTWIALSTREGETAQQFIWGKDREGNKAESAEAALRMVWDYLQGTSGE